MSTGFVQVEKCKVDGCNKPAVVKGYCSSHYRRLQIHGDPLFSKRQFHGVDTKVVGISLPVAIIEAAIEQAKEEELASGVTFLASLIAKSSFGKAALEKAGINLKEAAGRIVSHEDPKPKAKKARKRAKKVEAPATAELGN